MPKSVTIAARVDTALDADLDRLSAATGRTKSWLINEALRSYLAHEQAFQAAVRAGAVLAEQGAVVTFGITPHLPETGYGYIQSGEAYGAAADGSAKTIARFVEKPDLQTAQAYLDDGRYLWNSGLFMMRASVWLASLAGPKRRC